MRIHRVIDAITRPRIHGCRAAALGAILIGIATLGACADAPGEAERVADESNSIEGGTIDRTSHAVVVVIARTASGQQRICTGVLIDVDLVLTAHHCIAPTPSPVDCSSAVFGKIAFPADVRAGFSPTIQGETAWIIAQEIRVLAATNVVCGNDIALLVLSGPIPAFPFAPRLDRYVVEGDRYSAIGYGQTGEDAVDAGVRRRRDGLEVICTGALCGDSVDEVEWRGDAGVCNGDSGGPAIDEANRVIGVASRGPDGCDTPVYSGLAPFGRWLQNEAIRAARLADRTPAAWTGAAVALSPERDSSGCSVMSRAPRTIDSSIRALLAALALSRLRRSRA